MRVKGKKLAVSLLDLLLSAALLLGIWGGNYLLPQAEQEAPVLAEQTREKSLFTLDWRQKYAEQFSDTVISEDSLYVSPNLRVEITEHSMDTGITDHSENGDHEKYGTRVAYTLADIYVGDITCFQTVFAQDVYGTGYEERISSMSERVSAVLAVNGDSYNNNRHEDNGTIIRNGVAYRQKPTDAETCVLFRDGTMQIYSPEQMNEYPPDENEIWQTWVFGPGLLDEEGKARTDFLTWDYIRESHPRTAIGYYEPGHYCLLVADGRQPDYSRGMFLEEMAAVFEELGCKAAYNLDGGHCSFMTYESQVVSHPYDEEQKVADSIVITEGLR